MKPILVSLAIVAALAATPAAADCFADYKAKRDNPLRLHYGVIELTGPACSDMATARAEIAGRLARANWTLLKVQSIFGADGLKEREASAGKFYLRF